MSDQNIKLLLLRYLGGMEGGGRADMVGEPQTRRGLLPRRATPAARRIALVAPRVRHRQGPQTLLLFPFFKPDAVLSEDQKVRGMGGHDSTPRRALVG